MKKAERIVSYLLVLALVTGLFTGLGYAKSEAVDVKAAGNTLNVLEIVPTSDMATFGYMVKSWTDSNFASKAGAVSNYNNFKTYIQNAGLGTVNSSTLTSTDYFKTQVLGLASSDPLTISVTTKTPNDSDLISAVNNADFIVINQTVPSALRIGTQKKFSDSGYRFTDAQVLAIFKKVAGVEGQTPVPYIIDFTLMNQAGIVDARSLNSAFLDSSGNHTGSVGYTRADDLYNGSQGIGVGQGTAHSISTASDSNAYLGSDTTSYKLYKLLSSIDPATLYGLYFKENDGGYGIDKDLNIIGLAPDANGSSMQVSGSIYRLSTKMYGWMDVLFRPNYLTTSSRNVGTIMSKMGWFEAVSGDINTATVGNFLKVIGGSNGRGVVYKSGDGLFYAVEAVSGSSGGGVDLSSYTDVGEKVSISYSGNQDNGDTTITNTTSSALSNWYVQFTVDGLNAYRKDNPWNVNCNVSGSTVTIYSNAVNIPASGSITLQGAMNPADSSAITIVTSSGSSNLPKVGTMVNSFRTSASTKNDYHPYRILIVSGNLADKYANRTVIAEMVKVANDSGKGLAGGIFVDCVSRPQFEDIPNGTLKMYDMVCTIGTLSGIGATKLSSFSGIKVTDLSVDSNGSISAIVDKFKDDLFGQKIGVDYITVPTEYYTNYNASFTGENGYTSYLGLGSKTVAGNKNYINDNNNSGKRTLDFKYKVTGTSSYSADLYVDVDGDFKYEEDEKVSLEVNSSINNQVSIPLSDSHFFGEGGDDYVGGFSWKLVVKSGSQQVSRIGYSAIRNETTDKNVIKILQIYPTDSTEQYKQEAYSNPMLILPTRTEINSAIASKGQISNMSTNSEAAVKNLMKYFDNKLTIQQTTSFDTSSGKPGGTIQDHVYTVSSGGNGDRDKIVYNASLLYYFLDQLQDYDIDVTRYSVNQFNYAAEHNQVLYDSETGRLGLAGAGGAGVKNLDGSDRYGYSAAQLFGATGDAWKSETVTWTEGVFKKYLVAEGSTLIYGYRGTADGEVHYYGAHENGQTGALICTLNKDNEFDLVMIGFGNTLDWMNTYGVNLLVEYLTNGGPAFVGYGAVSRQSFNTFGNNTSIRNALGMTTGSSNSNYVYYDEGTSAKPIITTYDTIFSHYPYTINAIMKGTGDGKQPFVLNLTGGDNDPIVAFSKYIKSGPRGYSIWNDATENYYVYKKNNVVYCGFGEPTMTSEIKQQGGVLPMAETLMIVNALVASSRFGSSPDHNNPYINCKDDDCSVLDVTGLEDDQVGTNDAGEDVYYFKDSVYTDYDAYDIAAFNSDSSQTTFNKPVQNSGLGIPGVTITDDAWKTNIRWIRYEAELPTEAGGYAEFTTVTGTRVNLKVWSVADGAFVTPEDGKYHINRNGVYYIGVPLNGGHSAYSGVSGVKLGFLIDKNTPANSIDMFAIRMTLYKANKTTLLERHTISMIRRVLYHVK